MNQVTFGVPAGYVKLQWVAGYCKGTLAKDLKPGMITIWNGGAKEKILSVTPSKTGKTLSCEIQSLDSDYRGTRKLTANRLVVVEE